MGVANASFAEKLDGVWEGLGQQTSGFQWTIRFTALRGVYLVEYPSLSCNGHWVLQSETSGSATFTETIVTGTNNCINEGSVEVLMIENNKLRYTYYLPNGNIFAFGELKCSSCNINTTQDNASFKNGILNIPNIDVLDPFGGLVTYEVELSLVPLSTPLAFELIRADQK